MSKKLKSIKNPVVLIEHDSGQKAIYVNGLKALQADKFDLETIIQFCLDNQCNICRVESEHDGKFPHSFEDFLDVDIRTEKYCTF